MTTKIETLEETYARLLHTARDLRHAAHQLTDIAAGKSARLPRECGTFARVVALATSLAAQRWPESRAKIMHARVDLPDGPFRFSDSGYCSLGGACYNRYTKTAEIQPEVFVIDAVRALLPAVRAEADEAERQLAHFLSQV